MHVTTIRRYPVKAMRGEDLAHAQVEPWGLAGDRRWMVVDDHGVAITARDVPSMLLVRPTITANGLRLEIEGMEALDVAYPTPESRRSVKVWSSELVTAAADAAADTWLSDVMHRSVHLVHLDDPRGRRSDPRFSRSGDVVSLADTFPVLLTTEESLAVLSRAVVERSGGSAETVSMTRFRPNVVVAGDDGDLVAWAEDDWRRVRVGGPAGVVLRVAKGCARCVVTTIDPVTGQRGKEPMTTLARLRRFDGKTWFGVLATPEVPGPPPAIRVGDAVEILQSVPPGDGPPRATTS